MGKPKTKARAKAKVKLGLNVKLVLDLNWAEAGYETNIRARAIMS